MPQHTSAMAVLYDMMGNRIDQRMLYGHFASLRWDLPHLSTGVYMLRITGKGINTCKRVMVIDSQ
ncbi:MAG: T9SS type A sorting domain-containing protein [Bacteroidetes bacterium]|nr:T9SS type A sorting domain-containing protein [Bacteroidota bacterium]